MSHKYQVGDTVIIKDSPYHGALDNGKRGTVTKVTELRGETYAVHVLMDEIDQRSRRLGGNWCLYPREIEPAPKGKPRVDLAGIAVPKAANWQIKTCRGVVSGLSKAVDNLPKSRHPVVKEEQTRRTAMDRSIAKALNKPGTENNPILCEVGRGSGRHKWQTPGIHNITSYRSFRRYKAAGAAFGVIVLNTYTGKPEPDPVPVSVRLARFRAQAGLALVAIVSEVNA